MATSLLPDALWNLIEPLLPAPTPKPQGGRPRLSDRARLQGVLFVLRSGVPWRMLPQEMNCGSGMSCWRRLRDWQEAGIWQLIHFVLLDWLARYGQIDWSRAVVDGSSVRAIQHTPATIRSMPLGGRQISSSRPGRQVWASSFLRSSRTRPQCRDIHFRSLAVSRSERAG